MAKKGRPIPAHEKRGPRDHKVTVYLTKEEVDEVGKVSKGLGFRSPSAFLAFIIEPLTKDNFTAISFSRLGNKFANMVSERSDRGIAWGQLNPLHKLSVPDIETVNAEQDEATEKDSDK